MPTTVFAALSVFLGAGLGALLRWWFGTVLTPHFTIIPLGTLTSNLVGGFLVGVAVGVFTIRTDLSPELRLFIITGFMGGLTTFSSFSAEVVGLFARAQFGWALAAIGVHLLGSLALTALGILGVRWLLLGETSL